MANSAARCKGFRRMFSRSPVSPPVLGTPSLISSVTLAPGCPTQAEVWEQRTTYDCRPAKSYSQVIHTFGRPDCGPPKRSSHSYRARRRLLAASPCRQRALPNSIQFELLDLVVANRIAFDLAT